MPVLGTANALKLGNQNVDATYVGTTKTWPLVVPTPEHTIWPNTPFSPALTVYADGTPKITLAGVFYRTGTATNGWRIKGGRVYVPAGATGLPGTMQIMLYVTPYHTKPDLALPPDQSKTVPVVIGSWVRALFDTPRPMAVGTTEMAWIGYTFNDGHYLHVPIPAPDPVQSYDGSTIWRGAADDGGGNFSIYRIGTGPTDYSIGGAAYGTDAIWDEG